MSTAKRPPESRTADATAVDVVLSEHCGVTQAVTRVEACLDRHPDAEGVWLVALGAELPRLAETLCRHFEDEQAGPLYQSVPLAHPRFAERLQALEAEHETLLNSARVTANRARQMAARNFELHDLRAFNGEVQLLVARIRRHEAEENEIVLEAHWGEVGGGD
jgi:hypothetical protein